MVFSSKAPRCLGKTGQISLEIRRYEKPIHSPVCDGRNQIGLPFELQLLAFAVASLGRIVAWRAWRNRHPVTSDQPNLNERANHYVGRAYSLDTAIVNGVGKVRVGDTVWKVAGEDLPAGTRVMVIGVEGMTLRVERAE